ncbi:hypothetical protein E9993_12605 [Labilibacter sediminis]|nr:hypothetical protein E9993_12605 [Labilibacter sediminis]
MRATIHIMILLAIAVSGFAKEIIISPNNPTGLRNVKAGDIVLFKGGKYKGVYNLNNLRGTASKPIVIKAMPGEKVVFDGTDPLDGEWKEVTPFSPEGKLIQEAQWKRLEGKLYSLKVEVPIYSLIYKGRLMSDARWPNARWDDPWRLDRYYVLRRAEVSSTKGTLYDGLTTENTLTESSKWLHYDRSQCKHREEMLGDLGISFRDGIVVMSHTWGSWATRITNHKAGESHFDYDTKFTGSGKIQKEANTFLNNRIGWHKGTGKFKKSGHAGIQFFLMGLAALDIQEEWWYDEKTKTLYFITPDGKKPAEGEIEGKRRDYLLEVTNCKNLHIQGFDFYGGAALLKGCENSSLEDCNFYFSASQKFSVGNFDMPVTTRIENPNGKETRDKVYGNALINCQFTYLDGNAFEGRSNGLVIDNVLIYRTQQTTLGLDSRSMSINKPSVVRRVTIDDVGASVGIKGGGIASVYEFNNIMHFGGLQYDGASLQMGGRDKVIYRYNWSHDHPKRSYRFDAGGYPTYANAFGEMSYNVAWNTPGGFAIKGDDHLIHNNLIIGDGGFELFNMKQWASKNECTFVTNNIVANLSAGGYDWKKTGTRKNNATGKYEQVEDYWLKETEVSSDHPTIVGKDIQVFDDGNQRGRRKSPLLAIQRNNYHDDPSIVLRDPANLDFRLREGISLIDGGYTMTYKDVPWKDVVFTGADTWINQPDIGPYEANDKHYWIPGFKFPYASTPVPMNGTITAKKDCDLMWLSAYDTDKHIVYVGRSQSDIENAKEGGKVFVGDNNIYSFNHDLRPGETIFWRVDAIRNNDVIKGEVWSFTVEQ